MSRVGGTIGLRPACQGVGSNWLGKVGMSVLAGMAIGLLIFASAMWLYIVSVNETSTKTLGNLLGIGQLVIAGLLWIVTKNQSQIQKEEQRRALPIIKGEQVSMALGPGPVGQTAAVEFWNEGRQATQVRWLRLETKSLPAPDLVLERETRLAGGTAALPFNPIGQTIGPGEMWQLRVSCKDGSAIGSLKDARLTLTPVMGDPCTVHLTNLTLMFSSANF